MAVEKFHYQIKGTGPPLIFIHGILGFGRNFQSFSREFQKNYTCLTYDQRAHGLSLKEAPHTLEQLREDLHELIQKHLSFPVTLIGHSLGGWVALAFAKEYPEKLHQLVIVDSPLNPTPSDFQKVKDTLELLPPQFKSKEEIQHFFQEKVQQKIFSKTFAEFLKANLSEKENQFIFNFNRQAVLGISEDVRKHNFLEMVKNLKIKTLYIRGEHSLSFSKEDFQKLEAYPFIETKEIPKAGHWLHHEQKELFLEALKGFLKP